MKNTVSGALVLRHRNFDKLLDVPCDDSGVAVGGMLRQEGHDCNYFFLK